MTNMTTTKFLYLSRSDVETIDLPLARVIEAVELALSEKAHGRTDMPPKHWISLSEHRFFSAMSSTVPAADAVICKWQSGSSENAKIGLPYITGLLFLNDLHTGLTIAVMDSTWITGIRTAAASAVTARCLANPDPKILGIIGCGVQGRFTVAAMQEVFPGIETVRAYDVLPAALERFAQEMPAAHGVDVIPCEGPRDVAEGAQIVITGGYIQPDADRVMEAEWLTPGATAVAIDYDCYWTPQAIHDVDGFFTDDVRQMEHLKEYGYFVDTPPATAEIGEVVAGLKPGRTSTDQILLAMNLGVSVEDVTTARAVYDAARERQIGAWLDL
jgi:ornithine cyclodeaminase/alanine dehydrogenase-like protein (mu-crystallin family)